MALKLLAANNATALLAASISNTATSLTVSDASKFPVVTAGTNFFKLTMIDAATGSNTEIMHVTATTGSTFTVIRGREGTAARAWAVSDLVYNMMTAGTLDSFAQLESPEFTGNPLAPTQPPGTSNNRIASTEFVMSAIASVSGTLLGSPITYLNSGSYPKNPNSSFIIIEAVGGGGAGGGTPSTSSTQNSVAGGGASGGYVIAIIPASSLAANTSFTIGAAGISAPGISGGAGGNTTFGSFVTANGGTGGISGAASSSAYVLQPVAGGSSSATVGALLTAGGSPGGPAIFIGIGAATSGSGGNSPLGGGGGNGGSPVAGGYTNATAPGGGGGGGAVTASTSATKGGDGASGLIRIWEYG